MKTKLAPWAALAVFVAASSVSAGWPPPEAKAVPEADGFVVIPNAAVAPRRDRSYRAIFDATRAAANPNQLVPALNMAGSELNALAASNVPLSRAKFVVVFHGPALAGILDEAHYRNKFGVSNPNLAVIAALKKAGAELFVCGQNLASDGIDPSTLAPDVTVASDALVVLMTYQGEGYALLSF
jgi:intracellular sulfur oxidation DsrE/DsrF family protein